MSEHKIYSGLTPEQVEESRARHGANILAEPKRRSAWMRFLEKFKDPLIIVLLIAGMLSVCIACYDYWGLGQSAAVFFEPTGIVVAILLATGLGFIFELRAEREFAILNKVNDDEPVQVIRQGHVTEIPRRNVVVGDIVLLATGEEVPADGRLLEAVSLNVDESTLTGEPICAKSVDPADSDPEATFPTDEVLKGTKIVEGHGVMEVTAVGDATESGKVFEAAQIDNSVKTPLDEQLERLGRLISRASYAIAFAIVVARIGIYLGSHGGIHDLIPFLTYCLQTFMIAVTLVVVSVPEGLPMAVTLSLAYSMRRMLKTSNLVRKMHACETMGATTVICTDKTGTLTENKMQVASTEFFGNPPSEIIAEGIAVNSTAELDRTGSAPKAIGNPTEGALLLWLESRGCDYETLRAGAATVDELPFSTERKYMATVVERPDGLRILYVKGAPEIVFGLCTEIPEGLSSKELDATLLGYQNQGMRTLGFAYRVLPEGADPIVDRKLDSQGLVFLGIAAISDPVRSDVPAAVREVIDSGIAVKIVTGDTPATAREIGRQIGLWDDSRDTESGIITGPEFAALPDSELRQRIAELKIIARARPMDKKRLVETLQSLGEVVAVTGDGTNDAPALKAAQVGLSMGDGTSVAKEASDITIIDNSFSSIGRAVMWGRSLYRNIQRFVLFQLTVNVVACLVVLTGSLMGTESPLTVTQMLWVNLIMDTFAAMALASLPPTQSVMSDKPRPRKAFIITGTMWRFIISVGVIMFVLLAAILVWFRNYDISSLSTCMHAARNASSGLSAYELSVFFSVFVFLQFWNMFNARAYATRRSAFHFKGCSGFLTVAGMILLGQIAIVSIGGSFFSVVPLSLADWAIIITSTSSVLVFGEAWRQVKKLFNR